MATWVINDESCNLNFKQSGVSYRTLPKELIVLEIVLAGEPLNDTTVDNVFVRYEGKYVIELPYNDTTIGATSYASAELLRAAILALLNSNPCVGGGGGGGGDIKSDGSVNFTSNETWDNGGGDTVQIDVSGIQVDAGGITSYVNRTKGGFETTNGATTIGIYGDGGYIGFSSGSKLFTQKIHLTSAQIQTGNSVPIVLVAAAGAGTAIYAWHDTTARCVNGVVPATATKMKIQNTSSIFGHILFDSNFLASTTSNPIKGDDSAGANNDMVVIENEDLVVFFDADNPAYDGTIDIYLKYEIITL